MVAPAWPTAELSAGQARGWDCRAIILNLAIDVRSFVLITVFVSFFSRAFRTECSAPSHRSKSKEKTVSRQKHFQASAFFGATHVPLLLDQVFNEASLSGTTATAAATAIQILTG
jgi:hypothetical protein